MKIEGHEIELMYKAYQEQRETINPETYRAVLKAAHDYLEEQCEEENLQSIKQGTINKNSHTEHIQTDTTENWYHRIKNRIYIYSQTIGTMPIAGTAAAIMIALVAIPPIINETSSSYQYNVATLSDNHEMITDVIQSLDQFQYGFVSPEKPTSAAFNAGILLVDLLILNDKEESELAKQLKEKLLSIARKENNMQAVTLIENNKQSNIPMDELIRSFAGVFSTTTESSYFEMGQWVEYHYLLSTLALEKKNPSLFFEYKNREVDMLSVNNKLGQIQSINKTDINEIQTLTEQSDIDIFKLRNLSKLLLKIRTTAIIF